jgi:2,5-dichlorohydroquinone reductive dechlorinase
VVPTLIDRQEVAVVVDSRRICLYLDSHAGEADQLSPAGLAAAIEEQLTIVDNLPNYQLLMGRKVAESENVATRTDVGGAFSQRKVAWCDRFLQEHAGDATLVRAYTAKRAKELSAANELFSPEAMRAAFDRADSSLQVLERKLERRVGPWLFGGKVTMADLFWGVELLRTKNMGAATFWEGGRLPQVAGFSAATEELASIRTAVIDWPGAMF